MSFDQIHADIRTALAGVGRKHNIEIKAGTLTYGDNTFTCSIKGTMATGANAGKARWNEYCGKFGLTPAQFGTRFFFKENWFVVSDIAPRASKYPVLATKEGTDDVHKFTPKCISR
jgi:hypothetical protein